MTTALLFCPARQQNQQNRAFPSAFGYSRIDPGRPGEAPGTQNAATQISLLSQCLRFGTVEMAKRTTGKDGYKMLNSPLAQTCCGMSEIWGRLYASSRWCPSRRCARRWKRGEKTREPARRGYLRQDFADLKRASFVGKANQLRHSALTSADPHVGSSSLAMA
jgi:hypothetical protein